MDYVNMGINFGFGFAFGLAKSALLLIIIGLFINTTWNLIVTMYERFKR